MRRRSSPTPRVVRIGILGADVADMSMRVYETLLEGPRLVWADQNEHVYSSDPETVHSVLGSSIAGLYTIGHPLADIQGDIQALFGERGKDVLE